MIQTILLTALSAQLTLSKPSEASISPTPPQVVFTRVLPEENYVSYTVAKNDTLKSIALIYYGSSDYWTTLWNDNSWISDPNNLAVGKIIKINTTKPDKPDALIAELNQKEASLTAQSEAQTQVMYSYPTSTPTPTLVVSNAVSPISDVAITYLGNCEAGMNPARNSGNGYYGAFQFSYGTWKSLNTGYDRADLAPIDVQEAAVKQLLQRSSIYNQFPACAQKMHDAGLI